jgi:hypothetical protein
MTLIDDNARFSLLILVIVGLLLGLFVIGSMRVITDLSVQSICEKVNQTDGRQRGRSA